MSEEKHNKPRDGFGGVDWEDRLNSLDTIPGQETLDKGETWNRLYGRIGGKGYVNEYASGIADRYAKRYHLYRIAAACLLLAVLGGACFWFLQKQGRGADPVGKGSAGPAIVGRGAEDGRAVSNPAKAADDKVKSADEVKTDDKVKTDDEVTRDNKVITNDKEAVDSEPLTVGKKNTGVPRSGRWVRPREARAMSSIPSFVKKADTEPDFPQTSLSQRILSTGSLPQSTLPQDGLPQRILPQGAVAQAKSPQGGIPAISRGRAGGLSVVSLNEIPLRTDGIAANDTLQHSFKKKMYNPARLFLPALASEDPPLDPVIKIKLSAQN